MRGKPDILSKDFQPGGITPAHAGKMGVITGNQRYIRDHPRACGENHFLCRIARTKRRSPRACGENRIVELFGSQQNESPPCVGKTVVAPPFFNRGENHPRACSEIPQLFYVLSLSYYLSEISDSISTSVCSISKQSKIVFRVNRRAINTWDDGSRTRVQIPENRAYT